MAETTTKTDVRKSLMRAFDMALGQENGVYLFTDETRDLAEVCITWLEERGELE